jgi:diguanylate cyclase (GGDEF)-like protein
MAAITAADGYVELRQTNSEGLSVTVAASGDAALNAGEPLLTQPVSGTDWRVAYWPAPAAWQPSPLTIGLLAGSAALAVLLLVLAVTLPERMLKRALTHDAELLGTFFDDIRSGVLMDRYPFRLKEIAALARRLRRSGEAMIADRRALEHRTESDALTGLASRAAFEMRLEQLHHQAHTGFPSALLLTDIDSLEEINVQIGPEAGDILLKQFAQQLRIALRHSDMVARLDRGRFGVLFPLTDLAKIEPVVQRLRGKLAAEFDPGSGLPRAYAWSAGLTTLATSDSGPADALARAEAGLQAARDAGGNRTVTHMPPG